MSIRRISIYGFLTLIAGSLLSAGVLIYLLFYLDTIRAEQQVTENSYDALFEFKYYTERLLTTYDLDAELKLWSSSGVSFERHLEDLRRLRGEQSTEFNSLWKVIRTETVNIKTQLKNPLFQAKNTMDKSLLRRLGEGWNSKEESDYYIALSKLFNTIEYLKQYEGFLLDELGTLREHHMVEVRQRLQTTKWYAIVFPSAILILTLLLAYVISRLIGRNEHALMKARDELQISLDEFEHLFDTTLEAIFLVEEGRCIDVNAKSLEMFGYRDHDSVMGMSLSQMLSPDRQPCDVDVLATGEMVPCETEAIKADGTTFPVLFRSHNFMSRQRQIRIVAMLDLSDLKEKDRALQKTVEELRANQNKLMQQQRVLDHMAHHDMLTGLPNRAFFLEHLQQAISEPSPEQGKVAVFFIDLDRFKEINDSLGHTLGDRVLEVVSDRLRLSIERDASIARIGGDEFTLVVENVTDNDTLCHLAEKVIDLLQESMHVEGHELYITTSIGISIYPDDGDSEIMLLSNADAAMYRAKAEGRNTYRFYTADMTSTAYERVVMERNLRRAMEQEAFELYYQPQIDATSGRMVSAEALIRWPQEDGSMIPPDRFIPLAEDTGRIIQLGLWVLETACKQMVRWKEAGYAIERIAVNLSGKQLYQTGIYDDILQVLERTRCRPQWLELEVTEGYVMDDPEHAIEVLGKLKDLGIELAIDDFGTGYSSMTYLKNLPIHTLKIDQSFVRALPDSRDDSAIVHTVIALAKHLGLKLIAEGVETEEQKDFLVDAGCRYHQGYHYAKPLQAIEAEKLLLR